MSEILHDIMQKIKQVANLLETREVFTMVSIFLIAFASFGLGRLSKIEELHTPVQITQSALVFEAQRKSSAEQEIPTMQAIQEGGKYVASRNGAKYHLPWCSGALRIKEENKMWFDTKEAAEAAGYTPAANCKGI